MNGSLALGIWALDVSIGRPVACGENNVGVGGNIGG
jgi:hypothetical protein